MVTANCNPNPVIISFRTFVCNKGYMIGATSGAGTAYPSEALKFTCIFSGVCVDRSLVFCVMFCRSWFFLFLLASALSVLLSTASDYLFGFIKLFLQIAIM